MSEMKFNNDPEWLRRKAEAEDGCEVSVGGSAPSEWLTPEQRAEIGSELTAIRRLIHAQSPRCIHCGKSKHEGPCYCNYCGGIGCKDCCGTGKLSRRG